MYSTLPYTPAPEGQVQVWVRQGQVRRGRRVGGVLRVRLLTAQGPTQRRRGPGARRAAAQYGVLGCGGVQDEAGAVRQVAAVFGLPLVVTRLTGSSHITERPSSQAS